MAQWLNVDEAAAHLGISSSNLYSLVQSGRIPGHRLGKNWRFSKEELDAWVKASRPLKEFFVSADANIDDNAYLRDPQREGYTAVREFFEAGGTNAIVQLPVGCGKSGLIALIPFGVAKGRVLVIAPNLTIRDELSKALDIAKRRTCFWRKCRVLSDDVLAAGPYLAVLSGDDSNIHDCDRSHIVLTNIQQIASSADRWLPDFSHDYFQLILVDEGHHSAAPSWRKVTEWFPDAKVVHLTATPFRSDRKELTGDLIYSYSFKRAMAKGYIKKLQAAYVAPTEIFFTYQGDEHHHSLEEVLALKEEDWFKRGVALSEECNRHIVEASLDKLDKLRMSGTDHQLIASAMSIRHSRQIRSLYSERGYEAAEIHSQMDGNQRAEVLRKLRAGLLDCIVQVQVLGEGFDHPKLSVAAIYRPFKSLPPYVQFVGRVMRVIVQNDSRHPDNYGFIVTHVGMNLDTLAANFREMDRGDTSFFETLLAGEEPEPPRDVLDGSGRMRLGSDMEVAGEIVETLFEEDFVDQDDSVLVDELRARAEALGFDADKVVAAALDARTPSVRTSSAPGAFAVSPQRKRAEARRRLTEEEKYAAKLLLNRMDLSFVGLEISSKLAPGRVSGPNFAAAKQMISHEVNIQLGIKAGERKMLRTEDYKQAVDGLSLVLDKLTRELKKRKEELNDKG